MSDTQVSPDRAFGRLLEALPDKVVAALEVRDAWRRRVAAEAVGFEFLVSDLTRWTPGAAVRVAFLDGDDELHGRIVEATRQITDACNLTLDFGRDSSTGRCRRWTETDTEYAAEIRVSFDFGGYWSLVGTDSTDPTISDQSDPIGGRPHQRSLNLGGFAEELPADFAGTVRHEFLHALAFHHEHQNMRGPCESQFRWDDDAGYVPTKDPRGVFVPDAEGRSPGIYTYLAGAPNFWPRAKVDHNLRTKESPELIAAQFDAKSVMLYAFAPFFYRTNPSDCAPTGNGVDLSDGDRRGLQLLYPHTASDVAEIASRAQKSLEAWTADTGLESLGAEERAPYAGRVAELLESMSTAGA
jgi:hypothetical protein